jgi:hypothetical protein
MKRVLPLIIVIVLLASCKKSENDFIWERSYGKGTALFVKTTPDSGLIASGEVTGKPYLIRLNSSRKLILEYKGESAGLFSSVWFDTSGYIAGGNSGGKMLLARLSPKGTNLWNKSFDAGFNVDYSKLFYTGRGTLLAIGTASPDSSGSGATGLLFVRFDTTGNIIKVKNMMEATFISANNAVVDNSGNVFLAVTKKGVSSKTKASVAKYNDQLLKLWETDLFNNPDFGAASLAIKTDESGNVFVAGKTELSATNSVLNKSFLASLNPAGYVTWKRYLENSNEGSSIIFYGIANLMMLNKNCFVINILNPVDGADAGRVQTLNLCSSDNTDALGSDLDINYDKYILIAGSRGGSFYLALKSYR